MPWSGSPGILESGTPAPPLVGFERDAGFCESKANSANSAPMNSSTRPINARGLINAEWILEFFFILEIINLSGQQFVAWRKESGAFSEPYDLFGLSLLVNRKRC
jgi:hypothetical protein